MEKKANKPSDSKFIENGHCKHFWECHSEKDKRDKCIRFEQEGNDSERSKMDQD